jgi:acyl-coenzyme A synthetase/AMP-(fatty) acid ligase
MGSIERCPPFTTAVYDINNPSPSPGSIRTIPELIEYNAQNNAAHLFCIQAVTKPNRTYELLKVTHGDLKDAILRCSKWLISNVRELELPKELQGQIVKGRPIALFTESDLSLVIYLYALLHLGVPVVLLSARLSLVAFQHLLKETDVAAIITSDRLQSFVRDTGVDTSVYTRATFQELTSSSVREPETGVIGAPYHYIADEDRNVLILHSSGSTGLPKPIYQSHRYLLCFTRAHLFQSSSEAQALTLSTLPLYHGYGLITPGLSVGAGQPFCLPPSTIIPNAISTADLLYCAGARSLMTVPSILEDMVGLPANQGLERLIPLNFVAFGGGPLKATIGDRLATAGVKLLNHYGATEVGPIAPIFSPPQDYNWHYFRLRKDMNLELLPNGEGKYSIRAHPFGWKTAFDIQDCLVEDPNNPGRDFKNEGRKDDVVVLATGEKVSPQILELMVEERPDVKSAIAFGDNQFEIGLIIEPHASTGNLDQEQFIHSVWQTITEANKKMDAHGRISSPSSLILAISKPLPRSDKGSVMRKEAYRIFDTEIMSVYQRLEDSVLAQDVSPLDMDNLESSLLDLIRKQLGFQKSNQSFSVEDDFFELGMDSLQTIRLRRLLVASLDKTLINGVSNNYITPDFVYRHSSISHLAAAILAANSTEEHREDTQVVIEQLIERYSFKNEPRIVVLLTGATGSLGSHLLAHLVSLPTVHQVICLNRRSPNAEPGTSPDSKQVKACKSRELVITDEGWSKVKVFESDSYIECLGLQQSDYAYVSEQVTHILHNAWPVNFKRNLQSFQNQFATLQNLIKLASRASNERKCTPKRMIFISSIAVVGQYPQNFGSGMIPEIPMIKSDYVNSFGYGQAKFVCEKLMEQAATALSGKVEAVSIRIGQMSASQKSGYWNTVEHLAALIKSSQSIKSLPQLRGVSFSNTSRFMLNPTDSFLVTCRHHRSSNI